MASRETISVNISFVEYGSFKGLAIASPVNNPSEVLVTLPAIEKMLELDPDLARKKLEAKSLRPLLDKAFKLGKNTKTAAVLVSVEKCPESFSLPKNRITSAVPFDVFVVLTQAESRKNDAAFNLVVAGFADSFLSIVREQLKQRMSLSDRLQLLSSWRDALTAIRAMQPEELEDLIESGGVYPEPTLEKRMHWIKRMRANDPSLKPIEALARSGYLSAMLSAKYSPPIDSEQRQANLLEMAQYN